MMSVYLLLLLIFLYFCPSFAYDYATLPLDHAALRFSNNISHFYFDPSSSSSSTSSSTVHYSAIPLLIYTRSGACYRCIPQFLLSLPSGSTSDYLDTIDTRYSTTFFVYAADNNNNKHLLGEYSHTFTDKGVYTVFLQSVNASSPTSELLFSLSIDRSPSDPNIPIYIAFSVLLITLFAWTILSKWYQKEKSRRAHQANLQQERDGGVAYHPLSGGAFLPPVALGNDGSAPVANNGGGKKDKKPRLLSLDAFRGLCLTIMIFVNYGGGGYWYLNHSIWNGLTIADLVFPWFIWIMGTSMAISFESLLKKEPAATELLYKIFRRSIILFGLGLLISNNGDLDNYRIMGVLQRFGVSYCVVALIMCFIPRFSPQNAWTTSPYRDIIPYIYEWIAVMAILILHTAITFGLDVPGCGRGYLGAGGIGDEGRYQNCTGGAAGYVDRSILGSHHVYPRPTCHVIYHTGSYDPEGLLGSLTSIILTYIGVQSGRIIVHYKGVHRSIVGRWTCWGLFFGSIAMGLTGGVAEGGLIPINKNLWSLSFILALAGMGFLFLAFFYFIIDVLQLWKGQPFLYPGMNSIIIYCGSEILQGKFPFSYNLDEREANHHSSILIMNIIGVSCWILLAYYAYTIDFFIAI